jgi:hypothetical protein
LVVRPDETSQPVGLVDRDENLVAALIFYRQELALETFERAPDQAGYRPIP